MISILIRRPRRPASATTAYYVYEAGYSGCWALMATLTLVFQAQVAHLTPFQLVVVGTVLEAACFLGEVPTAVVADVYSRRLSILVGLVVMAGGFLLQSVPSFPAILIAQVVWGLGYTFLSGADVAWITDEVGEAHVQPVLTRAQQLGLATGFIGTIAAGALGLLQTRLPLIVSGVGLLLLAGWLWCRMPEDGFHRAPRAERETFRAMAQTLNIGVRSARRSPVVLSFLVIGLLTGLSSEAFDRLWTARVVDGLGLPGLFDASAAVWFTVFALIGSALSLATSLAANRWAKATMQADHPARLMAALTALQVLGIAGFALGPSLWPALAAMWLRQAAAALCYPVQTAWLGRNVDSTARATVLSINGQADAVGQVIGGPPLGALAGRTSIPLALTVSAAILAPAIWCYGRLKVAVGSARR